MIHKFTVENFYSFCKEEGVNFCASKNAPNTGAYFYGNFGDKISKIMSVSGANASGKTNLLKALPFISWFITESLGHDEAKEIPIRTFAFGNSPKKSIKMSVDFELDKKIYRYFLELNEDKVLYEELQVKKTQKFAYIFKRVWDEKMDNNYKLTLTKLGLPKDLDRFVRPKTSIISIAAQYGSELSKKIVDYWGNVKTNVSEGGRHHGNPSKSFLAADFFAKNKDLKETVDKLLAKFDLGLSKIQLDNMQSPNGRDKIYIPFGVHKYEKYPKEVVLPFMYESGGTQNLFSLLVAMLSGLRSGGLVILDEFDADLHPHMIPELIKLFTSKVSNPKNAQLFFSTHHHEIFNRLDKYQILITEKSETDGCSEVWRLDDVEGVAVRSDDNYYKKYLSGAYGGVPNIK